MDAERNYFDSKMNDAILSIQAHQQTFRFVIQSAVYIKGLNIKFCVRFSILNSLRILFSHCYRMRKIVGKPR